MNGYAACSTANSPHLSVKVKHGEMDKPRLQQHSRHTATQEKLLVGCVTSKLHASVPHEQICSDDCMCCHTET